MAELRLPPCHTGTGSGGTLRHIVATFSSTKETNMANKEQTEEKNDMPKCPYCGSDNVSYDNGSWICMDCWGEWPQDE